MTSGGPSPGADKRGLGVVVPSVLLRHFSSQSDLFGDRPAPVTLHDALHDRRLVAEDHDESLRVPADVAVLLLGKVHDASAIRVAALADQTKSLVRLGIAGSLDSFVDVSSEHLVPSHPAHVEVVASPR